VVFFHIFFLSNSLSISAESHVMGYILPFSQLKPKFRYLNSNYLMFMIILIWQAIAPQKLIPECTLFAKNFYQ